MLATAGAFSSVSRNDGFYIGGPVPLYCEESVEHRVTDRGCTGHIGRFDSRRYRQRRHRIDLFGGEMQRRAARRQDPHAGSRAQDRADQARGGKELLEVVEHKK